jgi:tetratricopeptide (TPR) repeat protein
MTLYTVTAVFAINVVAAIVRPMRSTTVLTVLILGLRSISAARGAPTAAPTAEAKAAYAAALATGRKLAKKNDLQGAIVSFKAALAAIPDDGRALSELGMAAFHLKDLAQAEKWTRRAIAMSTDPALQGASLYNLGRLEEERADKPAAIAAYKRSIEVRPNRVVRERLATLDAAAAGALDPFAPHAMQGPFKSVAAFCKEQRRAFDAEQKDNVDQDDSTGKDFAFACDEHEDEDDGPARGGPFAIKSPAAPWSAVRLLVTKETWEYSLENCYYATLWLAVETAAGWFLADVGHARAGRSDFTTLTIQSLALADFIPGGAPELVLRYQREYQSRRNEDTQSSDNLVLAGLGPSGKPSVTAAIQLKNRAVTDEDPSGDVKPTEQLEAFEDRFLPSGELEIKPGKSTKKVNPQTDLLGRHRLAFP